MGEDPEAAAAGGEEGGHGIPQPRRWRDEAQAMPGSGKRGKVERAPE